ncbi:DUF4328 domain-containing protein [Peterkaempfera sp. SMS 1(5)a]|uniref:DUF4328 domain-containing protein n=1 Tax=Peterkaempfera podocarpi TaxID=3232308 RepID=UPI00366EA4D6
MVTKTAGPVGGLARATCGILAAFVLVSVAAEVAAWHMYQVELAPLGPHQPDDGEFGPRMIANMWFGNLSGSCGAAFLAAVLLFIAWLANMRSRADVLWPEGQRRHSAWLIFGWLIPIGRLFIPKMYVNDLWAAAQPDLRRRRGHPLLAVWWLSVLAAGHWAVAPSAVERAATSQDVCRALQKVMLSDGLWIVAAALTIGVVWRLSGMLEPTVRAVPG